MKILGLLIFLFSLSTSQAQTTICQADTSYCSKICLDIEFGEFSTTTFKDTTYNYIEIDSTGKYTVLGNVRGDKAIGNWIFFIGDLNMNGVEDWFMGSVEKETLEGPWKYSYVVLDSTKMELTEVNMLVPIGNHEK